MLNIGEGAMGIILSIIQHTSNVSDGLPAPATALLPA